MAAPPRKQGKAQQGGPDDPLRGATDWLRGRQGPEARGAVLYDARVDVFRGKDFVKALTTHAPAWLHALPPLLPAQPTAQEQIEALGARPMWLRRRAGGLGMLQAHWPS